MKSDALLSPNQRKKYLAGLRGDAREARAAEIVYRREHRSNEPFVTDEGQPTQRSSHAADFERQYGRQAHDVADAAKLTGIPARILQAVYARGLAAWQTGHRPGASQHAWGLARVYSFATGGPTAHGPDRDLAEKAGLVKNPTDTFIPPEAVAKEARQALELRAAQPASNRCCTPVGIRRAAQLANRQPVSVDTLRRMKAYFDRHVVDAKGAGWRVDSKGWQAWLAWGGDSGRKWCNEVLAEIDGARHNPREFSQKGGHMAGKKQNPEWYDFGKQHTFLLQGVGGVKREYKGTFDEAIREAKAHSLKIDGVLGPGYGTITHIGRAPSQIVRNPAKGKKNPSMTEIERIADSWIAEAGAAGDSEAVEIAKIAAGYRRGGKVPSGDSYTKQQAQAALLRMEREAAQWRNPAKGKKRNPGADLRAVYSPVNAAWMLLFGDRPFDIDGQMTFRDKKELLGVLRTKGLKLQGSKVVVESATRNPSAEEHAKRGKRNLQLGQDSLQRAKQSGHKAEYLLAYSDAVEAYTDAMDAQDRITQRGAVALMKEASVPLLKNPAKGKKRNPSAAEHAKEAAHILKGGQYWLEDGVTTEKRVGKNLESRKDFAQAFARGYAGLREARYAGLNRAEQERAEKLMAEAMGGIERNPGKRLHNFKVLTNRGKLIALTTTLAEANKVCPKGGKVVAL